MSYRVKEIFYSLQGEGAQTGRASVFCRFSGCNLWNGKEEDKDQAICSFCDTDFLGTDGPRGGQYPDAAALIQAILSCWPNLAPNPYLIFTGGEPVLQLDEELITLAKKAGFTSAIETNGTKAVLPGIDWITVSPKLNTSLRQRSGSELKLVYPIGLTPEEFEELDFSYFFLSPLWSKNVQETQHNLKLARDYCLSNPRWRLSTQCHRQWGMP